MRVRGLAFVGLCVGAFLLPSSVTATAASSSSSLTSSTNTQNLDRFFSSDGPDSLHESINQGTVDEPRLWPQSNKWLHATLSDSEREFLSLAVTGSVPNGATSQLTSQALADTSGSVVAYVRFNFNSNNVPNNFNSNGTPFVTQLQTDLTNCNSGAISAAVQSVTLNSLPPTQSSTPNNEIYVSFVFRSTSTVAAGTLAQTFFNNYAQGGSSCRQTQTFQYIDLSFVPYFTYLQNQGQVSGTTTSPATNPCSPNPCINGGTCSNVPNNSPTPPLAYTCSCPTNYIGNQCNFFLSGNARKNRLAGSSKSRGKSFTRPNHMVKPGSF